MENRPLLATFILELLILSSSKAILGVNSFRMIIPLHLFWGLSSFSTHPSCRGLSSRSHVTIMVSTSLGYCLALRSSVLSCSLFTYSNLALVSNRDILNKTQNIHEQMLLFLSNYFLGKWRKLHKRHV